MRSFGKWLGRGLLTLVVLLGGIYFLAPREPVLRPPSFDPAVLGTDLDAYLTASEAAFADITPNTEKRIIWAGARGAKTPLALIYLHGFSATSEEIRPVPDLVARDLGANLFFTRLAGHGRGGAAMAEPHAGDWLTDLNEALAIGQRLGERTIVLATSTGGTLAAIGATDPELAGQIAGIVFVSPNFGLNSSAAFILDMPLARWWGPLVAGAERRFAPMNELHARFWTNTYPTVALFPMAALVRHAGTRDFGSAKTPALFVFSVDDQVVSPEATQRVADRWGGQVTLDTVVTGAGDDPFSHVIAGDALSPGQTAAMVERILLWIRNL